MKKNRVKIYWMLLLVLMYTASLVLSVGETQARYENTITKSMVLNSETEVGITSNCLVSEKDSPVTVLLGELPIQRATTVSFWLHSAGANASGNLRWQVADGEDSKGTSHAEYLDVTMHSGYDEIDPNTEIDLLEDVKLDLSMVLRPTDIARNTEHEKMNITVLVSWGEEMWGTFQVVLPEVELEIEETLPEQDPEADPSEETEENPQDPPADPEEDEQTQSYDETASQTYQSSGAEDEQADPDPDMQEDPVDPAPGTQEDPAGPDSDDQTDQDITTEPGDQEENENEEDPFVPDVNEGSEPDNREDPDWVEPEGTTETEPEEEEDALRPIRIETLSRFDPDGGLPLKLILTPDVTSVRLGLFSGEIADTVETVVGFVDLMEPFRNGTRFSLDGGECFYMMYKGSVVEFSVQDMTSLSVLLDFTYTNFQKNQELTLVMEAYAGEGLLETCIQKTVSNAQDAFQVSVLSREDLDRDEEARAEARAAYREDGIILNQNNAMEMLLPRDWQKMELEYTLERLTMNDHHTLSYVPVNMSADAWSVDYVNENHNHYLTLQTGANLPQAGTYRLILNWTYEGICYAQSQTTFFINYSAKTNYQLTSSEVPEND